MSIYCGPQTSFQISLHEISVVINDSSLLLQLVCPGSKWHLSFCKTKANNNKKQTTTKTRKAKMEERMGREEKELRGGRRYLNSHSGEEGDTESGRGGILCMF